MSPLARALLRHPLALHLSQYELDELITWLRSAVAYRVQPAGWLPKIYRAAKSRSRRALAVLERQSAAGNMPALPLCAWELLMGELARYGTDSPHAARDIRDTLSRVSSELRSDPEVRSAYQALEAFCAIREDYTHAALQLDKVAFKAG